MKQTIRIWDLSTRLFHWSLVLLTVLATVFVKQANLTAHALCGQLILALILFRIVWGFVGGETARFSHFVRGPKAAIIYLENILAGKKDLTIGHNPAGAFMILALLFSVGLQAVVGLFTVEETYAYFSAPLSYLVSADLSQLLTELHVQWFVVLMGLFIIHIGVNLLYYFWLKENLILPMITGVKVVESQKSIERPHPGNTWYGLLLILFMVGVVFIALEFLFTEEKVTQPPPVQSTAFESTDWE